MGKEVEATAPGRICLAGEDIDWITGPSILCAVGLKTKAFVSDSESIFRLRTRGSLNSEIDLLREQIGTYSHHVLDYTNAAVKVISDLGIDPNPISVEITSNLPAKAGLSSSAAVSVASVAAIANFYGFDLETAGICNLAYKIESEELKTGAGQMDMYSCGIGGLIYLDSSTTPPKNIEKFVLPDGFDIVIVDTLTPRSTADVIKDKRKRYENKETLIMKYIDTTNEAIYEMRYLLGGKVIDTAKLGSLITHCHTLMRDYMGVSTNLIEECISRSLKNGAIGAKLTGTGMGGCTFALVSNFDTARVTNSLKELPVRVYVTKPSSDGVTIDKIK
jgi:mevalonate kinase